MKVQRDTGIFVNICKHAGRGVAALDAIDIKDLAKTRPRPRLDPEGV